MYDMSNMVSFGLFDESESSLLRKCVLFYLTISSDEVPDSFDINRIHGLTNHVIRTDLQPVLRKKDSFDLQSAQKDVADYLTRLLVINDNERKYLEAFGNGEYKPELLFEDEDVVQRIRYHPMALWKIQNRNR